MTTKKRGLDLPKPPDKKTQTIHYTHGPNRAGQYGFIMQWWDENFHMGPQWRGQVFVADPKYYVDQAKAAGFKILEFDVRGEAFRLFSQKGD